MKNVNEIRIAALRLVDEVIRLQYNVNNGCYSDNQELGTKKARLEGVKKWALENNQIQEIRHYFAVSNFGHPFQFIASDLSEMFN